MARRDEECSPHRLRVVFGWTAELRRQLKAEG